MIHICSRTPQHTDEITYDDWIALGKRLPDLSGTQIRALLNQFGLRDKAYYGLTATDAGAGTLAFPNEMETADQDTTNTAPYDGSKEEDSKHAWVELYDDESGSVYYYNEETGESAWERPE